MLRLCFSLLVAMALSGPVFSQAKKEKKKDPADTIKNKFVPTGLRVGVDLISLVKTHVVKNFKLWEVNADLDFNRYYLTVDYGSWARSETLANGDYQNDGRYFRVGADFNFWKADKDKNMFFMGLRYGHSAFSESLSYHFSDTVPGQTYNYSKVLSNPSVTAHWIEITSGLRVKIWGPIWMGYTARLKLSPSTKGNGTINTFDIPGYGLAEKKNYWGINYQIFWRFPVRKIK